MPHATTQRRILIVDDNRDAADLLAQVLALYGHVTEVAYDGHAGLAAVERFCPDLLFLDIGMPQLDGYQVAARIRQMRHVPQPLLVAFTAWSDDDAKARVIAAGFDLHLTKPADFNVLLDTVLKSPPVAL
ncbi:MULTISPECIES: response regulator [unclassified Duganella]|uniref:response regulator n=1 Tax=unclassified Duganella TaxID=2636909 RepID=UPI00088CE286|nr:MULTISPECIES: response regulator [unclassified Duganella]SDF58993.1 Response regulator receiver domain-containing protein [Duganella sp. OV458]SDI69633.1 Response regulator receiver domain-containing protein [Duganella sp. OV510]